MKSLSQLTRALVSGALLASGLTAVMAVAGPVAGASAVVDTPTKVVGVAHAASVAVFLTQGGDVYTFGDNRNGQTGLGLTSGVTETPVKLPRFTAPGETVTQVSSAGTGVDAVSVALTDAGRVFTWGADARGALGDDAALVNKDTPVQVTPTWGGDLPTYVAAVSWGVRVVTQSGRVYAWGYNEWGQTGIDNGGANITTPTEVTALYRPNDRVVQIVGGTSSMHVRTASGLVLVAGSKARGQRGDGTFDPNNYNTYSPSLSELSFVGQGANNPIVSIGSGTSYSFAVSSTGRVWGWGFGQSGRLGDGLGTHDQLTPLEITVPLVDGGDKVVAVTMGGSANVSMLRTQLGHLYTVGSGNNGMLGNGATANTSTFGKITSWPGRTSGDPIVTAVVGASNSLAVTQSGLLYTWGNSLVTNQGGIGTGTQTPNVVSSPVLLAQPQVVLPFTDAVDASITGTVRVGQTLTASAGTYAPADAALSYAWKIGADTVGTASTYVPRLADAGNALTLTVTGTKSGYTDSSSTTAAVTVATVSGFTGTPTAGQTLTASDATGTLTWGLSTSSGCTSPTTSTGSTFVLPVDSAGKYVRLSQTLSGRTGAGTCVGPIAAATSPATISGPFTADGVVGEPFTYQPVVGGVPAPTVSVAAGVLPGGLTLDPATGEVSGTPTSSGTFVVTLRATNGSSQDLVLTIRVLDVITGVAPRIEGNAEVGVTMTGFPGVAITPANAGVLIRWQHESAPGEWTDLGVSGSTYTPGPSEVGRVYRIVATVSRTGYQTQTKTSAATAATVKGRFAISAPTVTGTAKVGETLSCAAAPGTPGTLTYAWTRGETALTTGPTYRLTPADRLHEVTCTVTSVRTGYDDATGAADSEAVGYGIFTIDAPAISGRAVVGSALTCEAADDTPGTLTYAWTRGSTALTTGTTYELTPADLDERVTCTVTAAREGYTDAQAEKDSAVVGLGTFTIDAPTVSGTAKVGQVLTCAVAQGTPGTAAYAWTRGDTALGLGASYTLTAADRGHEVTCTASVTRPGYEEASASRDSATVGYGTFTITAPSVTGAARVGGTLTCAAAQGTPGALSYRWTLGDVVLAGAASYEPTPDELGEELTCTVTAARDGYVDAEAATDSATIGAGAFTIAAPSVTGTAKVGESLTCAPADETPGTVTFAWTRGETALTAGPTYRLAAGDLGERVTCTVTAARPGYTDATSATDSDVVGAGTFTIAAPTVTGTAKVGETLSCAAADGTPGTVTFAWTRGETALAAGSTYELTADDLDEQVTCTATAVRPGYTDATAATDSPTVVRGTFTIGAPSLEGIAAVGETLTCAPAVGTPGTVSFAWSRGETALTTGATYELTPADRTREVTCTVTSERAGYVDATADVDSETVGFGTFTVDAPVVTGSAKVGETLTCAPADGTVGSVSLAWSRGSTPLQAGATYEATPDDLDQALTCEITAERDGYTDAVNETDSDPIGPGVFSVTAELVGATKVGETLTCVVPQDTPGTVAHVWTRDGETVGTDLTYVPAVADLGHALTCTVTVVRPGYEDATAQATTAPVQPGTPSSSYRASVTGTPKTGNALQARVTGAPAGATVRWQWYRGQSRIVGATRARYVLPPTLHRQRVRAVATVEVTGYEPATVSTPTRTVGAGRVTLALDKSRVYVGGQVRITVTNLLPGEKWTLRFGNGRFITSGRAPAAGGRLSTTVRLPREANFVDSKRFLNLVVNAPRRIGVAGFTLLRP